MKAVLITIGDEILSGNTVDTNSNFIANQLKNIGVKVVQIFTISDEIDVITKTLKSAFEIGDLVITTGGLGPTRDDKTVKAFAEYFEDEIVLDPVTFEHLKALLIKRNRGHLLDINTGQAHVLSTATILQNPNGTAPCQMVEKNGKIIFCLPGVPSEVKPFIKDQIIPILKEKFDFQSIVTRIVSVVGIPESLLAKTIEEWELALPEHLSLSYLPIGSRIKLRITAIGSEESTLNTELQSQIDELSKIIGDHIISTYDDRIEQILKDILVQRKLTISTAESCTGGGISRLITSISGSSSYFLGGVCTYETAKKSDILGVSSLLIKEKGVVSEEVASAMSLGCQNLFKTDIAVSTTGVAGPGSDEFNSEIGLVFYSVRIGEEEQTYRLFLPHMEREDFMNFVSQKVIQSVVERFLIKE